MSVILHMLFVDDEWEHRRDIRDMLKREFPDYEVDTAESYEEARQILKRARADGYVTRVVVVDEVLGSGPRGSDLLAYLREEFPAIRTVMLSARAEPQDLSRAINDGRVNRYILKSRFISKHELLFDAIRDVLEEGEGPFYNAVVTFLRRTVDAGAADHCLLVAGKKRMTARELLQEITLGTEIGQRHLESFAQLMCNAIMNPDLVLNALAQMKESEKEGQRDAISGQRFDSKQRHRAVDQPAGTKGADKPEPGTKKKAKATKKVGTRTRKKR